MRLGQSARFRALVAMAKNAVLKRVAESGMRRSGKTEHIYAIGFADSLGRVPKIISLMASFVRA